MALDPGGVRGAGGSRQPGLDRYRYADLALFGRRRHDVGRCSHRDRRDRHGRVHDLGGPITGTIPESRYLQVQVAWDSVSDWAPTLAAISIEYERLGETKRRRWQIGVIAQDRIVERDGGRHLRSGAEIVADLWQAWETGATVPFRDVDYDADPTERRVRVIGLSEQIPTPSRPTAIAAEPNHRHAAGGVMANARRSTYPKLKLRADRESLSEAGLPILIFDPCLIR